MSDGVDMEIVKEEASGFDKWVTGLVDLIPTQVYISKDMLPSNDDDKKLTKTEKRKRRLNPETCLTTSKLAFMNMEDSKSLISKDEDSVVRNAVNPEDLKAKLDAKLKEIRENQNRTTSNRTEDEQNAMRQKRKAKKEKQKKMKKVKTVAENGINGIKSPDRKITGQSGKVIFNKFDLIQDPIEKEKSANKVTTIYPFYFTFHPIKFYRKRHHWLCVLHLPKRRKNDYKNWKKKIRKRLRRRKIRLDGKMQKLGLRVKRFVMTPRY